MSGEVPTVIERNAHGIRSPAHPRYCLLITTEKSFGEDWPCEYKPYISKLAEAGFYHQNASWIQCVHCSMRLNFCGSIDKIMEALKDPWAGHAFINPNCPYVDLVKGNCYILDVLHRGFEELEVSQKKLR